MTSVILEDVSVDFPIYGSQRNLRRVLFERATGAFVQRENDRVTVKALRNISFTLNEGDRLGLVGHNGAGKSTLLKTIAGVYQPVQGRIFISGTVTALFDVLPGIDPEDTAYENIRTAGMLFGLSRKKIEQIMPDIEEFSELGEYMGLPVRTYSAGMTMRLRVRLRHVDGPRHPPARRGSRCRRRAICGSGGQAHGGFHRSQPTSSSSPATPTLWSKRCATRRR